MTEPPTAGFLLVDKPGGWTSHDVVAKVRSLTGAKAGHAGTLDPMATGLLVVGLGRSTRLIRFVQGQAKEYVARARLGVATDTLDADGAILSRSPLPVDEGTVRRAMERFVGDIMQVPPMVSAKKVGGKRLYALAREGVEVQRAPRPVTVHEFELLDLAPCDYPEIEFRAVVSTGTYIRTLADDLARALGGHAHLTSLRRTRIGDLRVDAASSIDAIEQATTAGTLDDLVVAPVDALSPLPKIVLAGELAAAAAHGVAIPVSAAETEVPDDASIAVLDPSGSMLGVFRSRGGVLRPEVVTA